jgi:hypothetical protein
VDLETARWLFWLGVWDKEAARVRLAAGDYKGYILDATKKLVRRLPTPSLWDFNDVIQGFTYYALEAIEDYDETRRAKFTTYLVSHLRTRSLQWFNWSWLPMNQPKGAGVFHFSAYEESSEQGEFDPTRVREDVSRNLEMSELLNNLSPKSNHMLKLFLGLIDNKLVEAFKSSRYETEVSRITGFSPEEVRAFVLEMRKVIPKYTSSIGA